MVCLHLPLTVLDPCSTVQHHQVQHQDVATHGQPPCTVVRAQIGPWLYLRRQQPHQGAAIISNPSLGESIMCTCLLGSACKLQCAIEFFADIFLETQDVFGIKIFLKCYKDTMISKNTMVLNTLHCFSTT